jgi:alkanesulfonate monooxygenase SsuD/methylene tetrahydromethanopterin reductase-like flavin-dependent oxidoreductase (luciferase family)
VESFARRRAFIDRCRNELGRDSEPFSTGMLVPVHIARPPGAAEAAAAAWAKLTNAATPLPARLFIAGGPDDIVQSLHLYWQAGCNEFVLGPADQGDHYLEQVEQLGEDVLPKVRAFS